MKKKVIITSKFNIMTGERNQNYGATEVSSKGEEWISDRMDVFMRFTYRCLKKQTNQDFTAVYAIADSSEEIIKKVLDKYEKLPDNIMFVKKSEYCDIIDKLSEGYDILYLTRLDSDDQYREDYVERLMNYEVKSETEVLLSTYGYAYDSVNNRLADYYHDSFTFYTFVYRLYKENIKYSSVLVTPWQLLLDFSHFHIVFFNREIMSGRNFVYNIHESNVVSKFFVHASPNVRLENVIEDPEEINLILSRFR